ncbi:MAG: hypothetical protein KBC95_01105 [Candidatus Peribacteraceae bacterium]|nr:hypothetical protein [Candidatus Peribacteraceae bacterium]
MTPFRTAVVGQDYSARRLVAEQLPVLTHLAEGRVLVDVGTTIVTPAGAEAAQAMAHFCSAGFQLIQLLKSGDGVPVRQDDNYAVIVPQLWVPPEPGFLQFQAHIRPNGQLVITPDPKVPPLFLPIASRLLKDSPWAHAEGRGTVAKSYGKKHLRDAFASHGELLKI